jgi:hypothetical protein
MRADYIQFYNQNYCTLVHVYMDTDKARDSKPTSKVQNGEKLRGVNSAPYGVEIELNGACANIGIGTVRRS